MINDKNMELHILGDLNCNMLTNTTANQLTKTLNEILKTYQLSQLITEPTRTANSYTLIDNYKTSTPEKIGTLCIHVSANPSTKEVKAI